jgi:hypothetical protein
VRSIDLLDLEDCVFEAKGVFHSALRVLYQTWRGIQPQQHLPSISIRAFPRGCHALSAFSSRMQAADQSLMADPYILTMWLNYSSHRLYRGTEYSLSVPTIHGASLRATLLGRQLNVAIMSRFPFSACAREARHVSYAHRPFKT